MCMAQIRAFVFALLRQWGGWPDFAIMADVHVRSWAVKVANDVSLIQISVTTCVFMLIGTYGQTFRVRWSLSLARAQGEDTGTL